MKFIASIHLFIIVWVNNFQTLKIQAIFFMNGMILHVVVIGEVGGLNTEVQNGVR